MALLYIKAKIIFVDCFIYNLDGYMRQENDLEQLEIIVSQLNKDLIIFNSITKKKIFLYLFNMKRHYSEWGQAIKMTTKNIRLNILFIAVAGHCINK